MSSNKNNCNHCNHNDYNSYDCHKKNKSNCAIVKCERGKRGHRGCHGDTGATGAVGATGASAVVECASDRDCIISTDRILVQQTQVINFDCDFFATNWLSTLLDGNGGVIEGYGTLMNGEGPFVIFLVNKTAVFLSSSASTCITNPYNCVINITFSLIFGPDYDLQNSLFGYSIDGVFTQIPSDTTGPLTIEVPIGSTFCFVQQVIDPDFGQGTGFVTVNNLIVDHCCLTVAVPRKLVATDPTIPICTNITARDMWSNAVTGGIGPDPLLYIPGITNPPVVGWNSDNFVAAVIASPSDNNIYDISVTFHFVAVDIDVNNGGYWFNCSLAYSECDSEFPGVASTASAISSAVEVTGAPKHYCSTFKFISLTLGASPIFTIKLTKNTYDGMYAFPLYVVGAKICSTPGLPPQPFSAPMPEIYRPVDTPV